jgi:hypothetical protein
VAKFFTAVYGRIFRRKSKGPRDQGKGPPPPPDWTPDWTGEHQAALAIFLRQPAGQDLVRRWRAVAATVAAQACADVFHTSHSAGTAHGWHEALRWFESLSRTSCVTDENGRASTGAAETDNQSPGRNELVELFAP